MQVQKSATEIGNSMSESSTFQYPAIRVEQKQGADPLYLMSASASDILEWAHVPRKRSEFQADYQRELDDRHKKIAEFLELDAKNIIPSAVIIAIPDEFVSAAELSSGTFLLDITVPGAKSEEEVLLATLTGFRSRLSQEELSSVASLADAILSDTYDYESEEAEEAPDTQEDEGMVPESYLTVLTAELEVAATDRERLPGERWKAIQSYLGTLLKPALILDGQHRVYGANEVESEDVLLPIVLLPGLTEEEQVFHFYVLNNKAKPLKPTQLRSIISTSLTNGEIETLESRLAQAGVKSEEAGWTHKINTDPRSPFLGLIDFGLDSAAPIPEAVMHTVAKAFLKPSRKYQMLFGGEQWLKDDDYRLQCFFELWRTVKQAYPGAWSAAIKAKKQDTERQIFYKANLRVLQELLMDHMLRSMPKRKMDKLESPLEDLEELQEEGSAGLYFLPEDFFLKEWTAKGLEHQEGRRLLRSTMEAAINNQGKNIGNLGLFKKS